MIMNLYRQKPTATKLTAVLADLEMSIYYSPEPIALKAFARRDADFEALRGDQHFMEIVGSQSNLHLPDKAAEP